MQPLPALEIDYNCIVTPYHVEGWDLALRDCHLLERYPNITHDLIYGSPIGNPPPLTYTSIPPNMPSATEHSDMVDAHFSDELLDICPALILLNKHIHSSMVISTLLLLVTLKGLLVVGSGG
jgi:hypothetical protein